MTDITELAQSLKAAAEKAGIEKWQVKRSGPGEYEVIVKGSLVKRSGWSTHRPVADEVVDKNTADFIALANPDNILELVEALEKAQQRNGELEQKHCGGALMEREIEHVEVTGKLISEIDIRDKRIDELEESHAQIIQSRDHYKRMTEEGLKQLAESRTVKMPEVRITVAESRRRNMTWRELGAYNEGADVAAERIGKALTAAGIKWEAE